MNSNHISSVDMVLPSYEYSFPKTTIKVLLLKDVHDSAVEVFCEQRFQVERIWKALPEDKLVKKIDFMPFLGNWSKNKVTTKVLDSARQLLAIGYISIETDQSDLKAAHIRSVPVFNAYFSNTCSVADLELCELIVLARKLTDRTRDAHAGT